MTACRHHHVLQDGPSPKGSSQGHTSFKILDPDQVFAALDIRPGQWVLDLGCGPGDYSIRAAGLAGGSGRVTAIDQRVEAIETLDHRARDLDLFNLRTMCWDITHPLPLEPAQFDLCLIATVLHGLGLDPEGRALFAEVARIIKPGGCLAIIELHKRDENFGPPRHLRIAPDEIKTAMAGTGFWPAGITDLGQAYLIRFCLNRPQSGKSG